MRLLSRVLLIILIVGAVASIAGWLFGPEAAGMAILVMAVTLGVHYGANWGGAQATKTEEYRRSLIRGKKVESTPGQSESTSED
jgi:hypothetical protein